MPAVAAVRSFNALRPRRRAAIRKEPVGDTAAKRSLIVGLGVTGVAVARYLCARGESVRVIDSRATPPGLDELRATCPDAEIVVETLDPRWLDDASRVLLSPGLAYDIPLALEARRRGLAVIGDIELFALAARAPVIAVTGSNGKSTVTTLASQMLKRRVSTLRPAAISAHRHSICSTPRPTPTCSRSRASRWRPPTASCRSRPRC